MRVALIVWACLLAVWMLATGASGACDSAGQCVAAQLTVVLAGLVVGLAVLAIVAVARRAWRGR